MFCATFIFQTRSSVEMLYHPEYAGKPLAVGGDPEARHGRCTGRN